MMGASLALTLHYRKVIDTEAPFDALPRSQEWREQLARHPLMQAAPPGYAVRLPTFLGGRGTMDLHLPPFSLCRCLTHLAPPPPRRLGLPRRRHAWLDSI